MNDLGYWFKGLVANGGPDVNEEIYKYLSPLDSAHLSKLVKRLDRVRSTTTALKGRAKKEWQGKKSKLIGKLFEDIIACLFKTSNAFRVVRNVRTTTNEIDILIEVLPLASNAMPFLRNFNHLIGEGKCYDCHPKSEWVQELIGIMNTHNTKLSILFLACPSKKISRETRMAIAINAATGFQVVPFGFKQFNAILGGDCFMKLLHQQYTSAAVHGTALEV